MIPNGQSRRQKQELETDEMYSDKVRDESKLTPRSRSYNIVAVGVMMMACPTHVHDGVLDASDGAVQG